MSQPPYPQHPDPWRPSPDDDAGSSVHADQHGTSGPYPAPAPPHYGQPVPPQHQPPFPQQTYPAYQTPQHQGYVPYGQPPAKGPLPTVLNVTGGIMLAAGVGLLIMAAILFWRTLPTDVLSADGTPGPQSAAYAGPGETTAATLDPDAHYTIYQVYPAGAHTHHGVPSDPAEIHAPDGEIITADSARINSSVSAGGMQAQGRWSFSVDQPGEYEIAMPEAEGTGPGSEEVFYVVIEGGEISALFGGIIGTLGGVFGGIFLCFVGGVLLLIGIIVGVTRRRRRRQYQQFYGHP